METRATADFDGGAAMTYEQSLECARRMLEHGVPDGMTYDEAVSLCERLILDATLCKANHSITKAAKRMGVSREGLYKRRKRLGLDIDPGGQKPIPENWRERLEATR